MEEPAVTSPLDDARVYLAAERTLLAWIRTGLAMMGFGFVIARFGLFLRELAQIGDNEPQHHHPGATLWFGTALIVLGIVVTLLSAYQHARSLQAYRHGEIRTAGSTLAMVLAIILSAMGLCWLRI